MCVSHAKANSIFMLLSSPSINRKLFNVTLCVLNKDFIGIITHFNLHFFIIGINACLSLF